MRPDAHIAPQKAQLASLPVSVISHASTSSELQLARVVLHAVTRHAMSSACMFPLHW